MQASVSIEALQDVKKALNGFSADISGIAFRIEKRVNETLYSGQKSVNQAEAAVNESLMMERELSRQLETITAELSRVEDEYQQCLSKIDFLTGRIDGIRKEIGYLNGDVASARSGMQSAQASNDQASVNRYSDQIRTLEMQISRMESECQALTAQKSAENNRRQMLYTQRQNLSNRQRACREKLDSERSRLICRESKRDRLKQAYWNMERELQAYVSAAKALEYSSNHVAERNISAVQKCIQSIEKYLNTPI